ncbi:hypothetical protein G7046_g6989 [Stylonectria norvegica]|nr:hypothetical protein G7046_g6989 [Stylonectria norvegica]
MDMDGMDGMEHDSGMGMDVNYAFARDYWYIIAGVVGSLTIIRAVNHYDAQQRLKACQNSSVEHPTRPQGPFSQAWATATAMIREMGYPQVYISINGLRWATPPPLGRILVLASYWAMIVYFMSWNAVKHDVYYWERIGYRNAWVSIAQFPLIYLLSMKLNVVGFLIGTGHERLNWLHRWVARTMFVTATVHGFHFWTSWVRADFVSYELQIMPLVRYGLGAWGLLLWTVVTGFVPIRRLAYEFWVAQHVIVSILMLWLLHMHIPADARYLLWMSISFLVFDRAARWVLLLWQNVRVKPDRSRCSGMKRMGHRVAARAVGPSTTVVTIRDVHFEWKAGQHVYLWIPRLGPFEAHPYTIAFAENIKNTCCCNSIQLIVRAQKGFSKRVHDYATKNPESDLTGFISGPYGAPPRSDIYETMVLIGASTGASFMVPILERIANSEEKSCIRRVEMVLMAKTAAEINYYVERAQEAGKIARDRGIAVRIHIAITGASKGGEAGITFNEAPAESDSDTSIPEKKTEGCCCAASEKDTDAGTSGESSTGSPARSITTPDFIREYTSRPDIEALIREPVEQAWGETGIVVCGGREVVARTRNCVSRLSDERAVHKGTGAQGIYLHVEEVFALFASVAAVTAGFRLFWDFPYQSHKIIPGLFGGTLSMVHDTWELATMHQIFYDLDGNTWPLSRNTKLWHGFISIVLCGTGFAILWLADLPHCPTGVYPDKNWWLGWDVGILLWSLLGVIIWRVIFLPLDMTAHWCLDRQRRSLAASRGRSIQRTDCLSGGNRQEYDFRAFA